MSSKSIKNLFVFSLRITILLAAVSIAVVLGRFGQYPSAVTAAFLLVGVVALLLMGFTFPEMRRAVGGLWRAKPPDAQEGRSVYFWEAAARNVLGLGVLGTIAGFAIQISSKSGTPGLFPAVMADTVLTAVYSLVLAAFFSMMGLRLKSRSREAEQWDSAETGWQPSSGWGSWIGSALFSSLILWAILAPAAEGSSFSPSDWLFCWPAWLSVWGGAVALGLFLGAWRNGPALTLGFAYAGTISALVGLVRAISGFSETSIPLVASGCSLMISSCFAALVGMLAAAASRQDRNRAFPGHTTRLAWYGLPVAGLLVLALVVLMVMIPITIKAQTGG